MSSEDLAQFVESVTGESHLRVEDDFGDGFVRLRSAEAERRQAKHDVRSVEDIVIEMLRNARDAHAHSIYLATGREGNTRRLVMLDDGDGVPDHMRERIFEARVTSKLDTVHMDTWGIHGRGMALYAIRENAKLARIQETMPAGGSSFLVETDATKLPEKTDQSTHPAFIRTAAGTVTVRGPRNIVRTATEFAYIDRTSVQVYMGSAIEIAATLWAFGRSVLSKSTLAFCNDPAQLPILKRISIAGTPEEFADIAASLGLQLSARSARRIMDGQIQPLQDLASQVVIRDENAKPQRAKKSAAPAHATDQPDDGLLHVDPRSLKIAPEDLAAFRAGVARAYADLAEAYYLDENVVPSVSVQKNGIRITIPVVMER